MKVMVAIPTYNGLIGYIQDKLNQLLKYSNDNGVEVFAMRYERIRIDIARDNAVRQAIELKTDFMLFLDDDNPCDEDTLIKLLSYDKDIIGSIIPRRNPPHVPCIFEYSTDMAGYKPFDKIPTDKEIFEVAAIGMGCTLLRTSMLKDLYDKHLESPFGFSSEEKVIDGKRRLLNIGEDIAFCRRAKKRGYKVFAARDSRVGHIIKPLIAKYTKDFEIDFERY